MHQSALQLSYRLQAGQTDLRPLRVLASRELTWGSWGVRIHVLGASHAVEFRRGDDCVTELLTCVRPIFTQTPLIGMQADTPGHGCARAFGLTCRVRLAPFCLLDGDALTARFANECRLDVNFPCAGGGAPVTRVGWRRTGPCLTIETVHSYPEEGCGVRSVSVFDQKEAQR